jgi:type IV pilus assembly protein PilA
MTARANKGFTLIELMIVVAIIAIIAAIALPSYQDYTIRSQVSEGVVLASGARAAVWEFVSQRGYMPPNNFSAGLPSSTSIKGKYVTSVLIGANTILATFGNRANTAISGKALRLTPVIQDGTIDWSCSSATLDQRYLPTVCR